MADDADMANDYIDSEVARALGKFRQQNVKNMPSSPNCKECNEPIPAPRRELGFQFCIECAAEIERRKSLFAE